MKWDEVKLSECCLSISDGDHQPPPKASEGIPFVTIANINTSNQFDFSDTMFVPCEYYNSLDEKRKPKVGDVLYSVVGSFGIPVLIKDTTPFVFQRHIAILRPNDKAVPAFLYYTMRSRDFYAKADAAAIGAAQRTISLSALRGMKISLPPKQVQEAIVEKLSPYDSLIENNQKQIKLLEEAAQRLYKEWFVDLHFPGHENTPIVNGIPKGWYKEQIDNVYSIKYGNTLPTSKLLRKAQYPVYGASKVIGFFDRKNCDNYSVLITSRGNAGAVSRTHHKECFVTNNSFIVIPKSDVLHVPFIYYQMDALDFKAITTGSCQPQLTNSAISMKTVLVPSAEILIQFNRVADALFEQIELRLQNNVLLAEARDRVLPKLMSGEIEVK